MNAESAKAKLEAAKQKLGRDIRVFETSVISQAQIPASNNDEDDDMYEFTPEDYYRALGPKKQDKVLKTRKIREAEEAARRARLTKIHGPDKIVIDFECVKGFKVIGDDSQRRISRSKSVSNGVSNRHMHTPVGEVHLKIQLKILAEEMQAINRGLERVTEELDASKSDGPVSEVFVKRKCFNGGWC